MTYAIRVYWRMLLIRLGLRRATMGDMLDRLIQRRDTPSR